MKLFPGSRRSRWNANVRLILLNGPPGIGKSTIARMYCDDHRLALNLDIDHIRAMLGQWQEDSHNAGLRARAIALAAARTHLAAGHDVVVPQFLGRPHFIEELEAVADGANAEFHEIVLLDDRAAAIARFKRRGSYREVTVTELATMYERLTSIVSDRPGAVVVRSVNGEVRRTYRDVLDIVTTSRSSCP